MNETTLSKEERFIKFSLLVLFGIISNICMIYIFYYVMKNRSFRRRFHHQTLMILICIVFFNTMFNMPTAFSFYARGHALQNSKTFCIIWGVIDNIFTSAIIWCQGIFTLERYLFVFHPNIYRTEQQKFLFHYIPLVGINLYLILFYPLVTLWPYCKYQVNYNEYLCGYQCLDYSNTITKFNWIFNTLFPSFVIIFVSLILLLRVLWTRRIMQRNLRNWSKNWKMIVQLLGISSIYTAIWLPFSIISLIETFGSDFQHVHKISEQFYFVSYLCEMSVPVIALLFWPEIIQKLYRRVRPTTIASITRGPYSTK